MIDQNSRPARKVGIADHLWETYEDMAQQMGSDRDALINQALFMFARLNGFIEARSRGEAPVAAVAAAAPAAAARPAPAAAAPAARPSAPPVLAPAPAPKAEAPPPPPRGASRPTADERAAANGLDNDPVRREVAERVLETAAELERLIKGKNEPPPPNDEMVEEEEEEEPLPEPEDPALEDEQAEPEDEQVDELPEEGGALYLVTESGEQERIVKERFVIGRGKHCDFVINSGKVSREHAVIAQEGNDWIIEDLGSSNGTWFNKARIKRRKIEDGDEYFICSEKIRLVVR
ncbi:FHA domain-containing protein [Myxococcus stipitatus]|uniref:FHA domain-containing protein n=1 Tax=Myxococcus stipitatus TaxID=83455 RepID=UPI001F46DD80|nr:FHA domain-containing protein [Myxococcus stipitatus]MCE9672463.1 FHA domain-containing protein [Myxococcus stipitatus]